MRNGFHLDDAHLSLSSVACSTAAARLTAEETAFREARGVDESMPIPHSTWASIAHSRYAAALASPPADNACSA